MLPPLIVAVVVFAACLFGIWTRPTGFLATFWPANAVMLAILIRMPGAASPAGWIAGCIAFVAADLLTGSPLIKALLLNAANLTGIAAAYLVYARFPPAGSDFRDPTSMLHLLLAAAAGGAAAGVAGGAINPMLFNAGMINGWVFWFATEFVNYVAILPVILSAPAWSELRQRLRTSLALRKADTPPVAALAASFGIALLIGGPGAIAFPVPALLWCGLAYPVFPTATLTLLFSIWSLVVISTGYVAVQPNDEMTLISLRLGISMVAVMPIILACVMQNRNDLLARLYHQATHDPLTGVTNRKAFREEAQKRMARATRPYALLMFDLDHFKAVNDTHGHAVGDEVLVAFAERASACLRAHDLFGRLGGEEFAAMIFDCDENHMEALVDRIRSACRKPLALNDGRMLEVSTSIGVAIANPLNGVFAIDALLHSADTMLYRAKEAGRDRAEISVIPPAQALASGDIAE